MLPALSVSKSVSAYSPSFSSKLKMTSVITAVAVATERTNAAVATTALMRKAGDFMQIIPATADRRVKSFLRSDKSAERSSDDRKTRELHEQREKPIEAGL